MKTCGKKCTKLRGYECTPCREATEIEEKAKQRQKVNSIIIDKLSNFHF